MDHVADLEQIGPLLHDILQEVPLPEFKESPDGPLQDILAMVGQHANIDFRQYKPTTILRRIGRRMAITHKRDIADYAQYIKSTPDEVQELVKAFLIKVTKFFRDPEAFR